MNRHHYRLLVMMDILIILALMYFIYPVIGPSHAIRVNHPQSESLNTDKPNVILVTFDALRADHLGVYGYEKNISPNIDSFAGKSYVFKDSLSQCGSTICSLPSLHTSRFPYLDNLLDEGTILKEEETTLAEILKEYNYSTLAVVGVRYAKSEYGISQGFDVFNENFDIPVLERTMDILDNNTEEPFFLWVHFRRPHAVYDITEENFRELYPNPDNEPTVYGNSKYDQILDYYSKTKDEPVEEYKLLDRGKSNLTPSMLSQYRAMYDGNIKEVDRDFGKLMDYINASGLSDNTIIIISADHGESQGEHNIFDHNYLYYGMLHTPLIFHLPNNEHRIIEYPVMNVDIFPTVLGILDIRFNGTIRGEDLFNENRANAFQFAEYTKEKTIKRNGYKLIFYPKKHSRNRLFYLIEDPDENIDLSTHHPDIVQELMQLWENISKSKNATYQEEVDTLELLKSVGYAQ